VHDPRPVEKGARLLIANTISVPTRSSCSNRRYAYPATVVWRQTNALGVKFDGPPTSTGDDANRRYARLKFV
jgi:hypothetical protein